VCAQSFMGREPLSPVEKTYRSPITQDDVGWKERGARTGRKEKGELPCFMEGKVSSLELSEKGGIRVLFLGSKSKKGEGGVYWREEKI